MSSVQGLRNNGVRTSAEVVEVTTVKGSNNYTLRYALEDGQLVTCQTGDVFGGAAPGDKVQVLYDREAADVNCQSADYGTDLTAPVIFIAGGVVMLAVAAGAGIRRR